MRLLLEMATSGSQSVNGSKMDEQKREIKLSIKALANKIENLQKERKAMVNKTKGLTNIIKDLMQNDDNVPQVRSQLETLVQMVENTKLLHESLVPILPKEEQEKQNEWFSNVLKCNNGFMEDVRQWFSDTGRQISNTIAHVATSYVGNDEINGINTRDVPMSVTQQGSTHIERSVHHDENESCFKAFWAKC